MKKWLQKRSFMVTIAFVIILIGIVVWFLIGTKTFGYYFHGAKIKNVEYIEVRIDGGEEDDYILKFTGTVKDILYGMAVLS